MHTRVLSSFDTLTLQKVSSREATRHPARELDPQRPQTLSVYAFRFARSRQGAVIQECVRRRAHDHVENRQRSGLPDLVREAHQSLEDAGIPTRSRQPSLLLRDRLPERALYELGSRIPIYTEQNCAARRRCSRKHWLASAWPAACGRRLRKRGKLLGANTDRVNPMTSTFC